MLLQKLAITFDDEVQHYPWKVKVPWVDLLVRIGNSKEFTRSGIWGTDIHPAVDQVGEWGGNELWNEADGRVLGFHSFGDIVCFMIELDRPKPEYIWRM